LRPPAKQKFGSISRSLEGLGASRLLKNSD
jgi:hypothetical protein